MHERRLEQIAAGTRQASPEEITLMASLAMDRQVYATALMEIEGMAADVCGDREDRGVVGRIRDRARAALRVAVPWMDRGV